jgi:hypothetical protein
VRWLIVDIRNGFPRGEVLLPISVLGHPDLLRRRLVINLTMRQIAASLPAECHPPVSREHALERHDPHLRSVEAVIGHRAYLLDNVIGHVEELLVRDDDWSIRYIRLDTCKWRPGDRLLLTPRLVGEINWTGRLVRFGTSCGEVEGDQLRPDVIWMRGGRDRKRTDT